MELYIGGYAQGKTEYVKNKYSGALFFENYEEGLRSAGAEICVWNRFHLAVKNMLEIGKDKEEILALVFQLEKECGKLIVISDEIGNGIVPLEKEDRLRREETGRILCKLAEHSDSVERILCGVAQRIK